jgi:hypothetical protein
MRGAVRALSLFFFGTRQGAGETAKIHPSSAAQMEASSPDCEVNDAAPQSGWLDMVAFQSATRLTLSAAIWS